MPHRDAHVVEAQHHELVTGFRIAQPIGIERVEVLRRAECQLFDLRLGTCAPVLHLLRSARMTWESAKVQERDQLGQ
ncbi:MAG: hypothetical protein ABIY55_04230 [Kofleriaceae bacterium]